MPEATFGNVTPTEAVNAMQRRQQVPVETFSWWDIWQHEHSQAFTVAKTAGFDVLSDIQEAVKGALEDGTTFAIFQKKLIPILQEKGWWGRAPALDPETGESPVSQLGSPRRLQIIFDTNMRTSYAAGRWARFQRTKADRPYLMYSAVLDNRTRPQHRAWHGTTLPIDDPWWQTHFPPNGWNCRCTVVSLSEEQHARMHAAGQIKTQAPPTEMVEFRNNRTGEIATVPKGIDPGFGYNVGTAFLEALKEGQP